LGLLVRPPPRFLASGEGAATRNEYKYIRRAASFDRIIKVTQEREFAVDGSDKDDKIAPRWGFLRSPCALSSLALAKEFSNVGLWRKAAVHAQTGYRDESRPTSNSQNLK
jgi:hypothetical protein